MHGETIKIYPEYSVSNAPHFAKHRYPKMPTENPKNGEEFPSKTRKLNIALTEQPSLINCYNINKQMHEILLHLQ
jgi:hypothetical protein